MGPARVRQSLCQTPYTGRRRGQSGDTRLTYVWVAGPRAPALGMTPRSDKLEDDTTNREGTLRETVREAIRTGKLPSRRPDRVWGGRGDGTTCSVCHVPVGADEIEFELEFITAGDVAGHHVHSDCFAVWDGERETITPADDELPRSA